jgi:hypothetical protein
MSAVDTLRPGSIPDTPNPKSKFDILRDVIGALADTDQTDTNLSGKVQAAVVAAGRAGPDSSASNLASVKGRVKSVTKTAVKEMFAEQDLSEEFKEQAADIFADALETRLALEVIRLEEETASVIERYEEELEEKAVDKISTHLDACVERWLEENQVPIEYALRGEVTESINESVAPPKMQVYADAISRLMR